jgi:hypothetical protein
METQVEGRTGKLTKRWTWKHKLTGTKVHRYRTKSGKKFDTGVLSHCLKMIEEGENRAAFIRAQRVLELNGKKSQTVVEAMNDQARVLNCETLLTQWVSVLLFFFLFCFCWSATLILVLLSHIGPVGNVLH